MSEEIKSTVPAVPETVVKMREQLPELLKNNLPKLEKWSARAHAELDSIVKPTNDEEREDANASLAAVRDVYNASMKARKEMTDITDAFKDMVMEYERPFDSKAGAKSKYNEKRKLIEDYDQEKLERVRKEQAETAKKKEVENLKVDLRSRILQSLSDNVVATVKKADDYARELFATLTVDNFDTHAEQFKKQKPKLKLDTYNACFVVPNDLIPRAKTLLQGGDFTAFVEELQKEESYDRWNSAIQEAVSPVLNEWRARIPDLKLECIEKSKASEEEKLRLDDERKKRDEQEKENRQKLLDKAAEDQKAKIQEEANMNKMSNEFAAQAANQTLEEAGGVKQVLKFNDPKTTPKALMAIIFHCFSHPEFQGIQKRDKNKKLVFDSKGRPEYVEEVQAWIDFFLKKCDGQVEGTQIFEDAKTIVRK
jgi:hypothetical protein